MRILIVLLLFIDIAHAQVPERCYEYQKYLTKEARTVFGPDAPIASLAAQIQQESGCRPLAMSPVGAQGLTQFMPGTARDLARLYPTELGPADPLNWRWAISAQVRYMRDLTKRNEGATRCDTWCFGQSSYNGGEGWLHRDQLVCAAKNVRPYGYCDPLMCDARRWRGNVELTPDTRRAPANIRENRQYVERIRKLESKYVAALWGPGACHAD